jgi:hypothetical protein
MVNPKLAKITVAYNVDQDIRIIKGFLPPGIFIIFSNNINKGI